MRKRGELALPGAPAALAKLTVRMLSSDPAERPASGGEAYEQLAAIQKVLEPKRLLWAGLSIAAAAVVGAGAFAHFWQRPLPPGRLLTAVADTDNRTGDPDLDGASELLRIGLEQSRRMTVMTRSRLVGALRETGGEIPRAIGEDQALDAARKLQAQVVVAPAIRPAASGYDVALMDRVIEASPDYLVAIGRVDEALDRARRVAAAFPSATNFCVLAEAHRLRGEVSSALDAARRANAVHGGPICMKPFVDADALDEAAALHAATRHEPGPWWLAARGRVREALKAREKELPSQGTGLRAHHGRGMRGRLLLVREDPDELWRLAEAMLRHGAGLPIGVGARYLSVVGWELAVIGDLDRASRLLALGRDRLIPVRMTEAILCWKRGDRARALELFEGIAVPSSELHRGEILSELGRDREAVELFRLYRRLRGSNKSDALNAYHYPRSLYIEALALERLGERDEARKVLGRLLHLWEKADRDLPLPRPGEGPPEAPRRRDREEVTRARE